MILYHYTSNEALLSIIKSRKIWLTSLTESNDPLEGDFFYDQVRDCLFQEDVANHIRDTFNYQVQAYKFAKSALGMCFSQEGDLLSQWRGYADDGSGVAIGFDFEGMKALAKRSHQVRLSKVNYSTFRHSDFPRNEIINLFNEQCPQLIDAYKNENINLKTSAQLLQAISEEPKNWKEMYKTIDREMNAFIQEISSYRFLFKNPFFNEEKEWRLYKPYLEIPGSLDANACEFKNVGDKISPYQPFPKDMFEQSLVSEVILGPKNQTSKISVEMLMKRYGFKHPRVRRSNGSYR